MDVTVEMTLVVIDAANAALEAIIGKVSFLLLSPKLNLANSVVS